jgi:hypothetical protein
MTELKKELCSNEEIIQKNLLSEYFTDKRNDHEKLESTLHIRDALYREIINLINDTRYYMLGPEKGLTARFIAENHEDIFQILIKIIQNYNLNQNIKRRE